MQKDASASGADTRNIDSEGPSPRAPDSSKPHAEEKLAPTAWYGTKAETLEALRPLLSHCQVPRLLYFTSAEWAQNPESVCARIHLHFGDCPVAVRSSAFNEDTQHQSMAGAFKSILNVATETASLKRAIEEVFASYTQPHPKDQVLVQTMLSSVDMSGVVMTADLSNGAPYYIINYDDESGKTDAVTGGTGVHKAVVIHHEAPDVYVQSPRVRHVLEMVQEIEKVRRSREPLDIEFAMTRDGTMHLLQARPVAVQKNWNRAVRTRISESLEHLEQFFVEHSRPRPTVSGGSTILGQMPDWNPAELIGSFPSPLAASLFQRLISNTVWQEARALMGYRPVPFEPLMLLLAGRPYIDVRNSFNSFLPTGLPPETETALVDGWLSRLAEHPEFHDKVEFEVAQTVYDFSFEENHRLRYPGLLNAERRAQYQASLRELTARNVTTGLSGKLAWALGEIEQLSALQEKAHAHSGLAPLRRAMRLLDECKQLGTLPFAVVARHAFIAEALLRSTVQRGAWAPERLAAFKGSLKTVASGLGEDFRLVTQGQKSPEEFLRRYGHLRPGTFDILSPRYDKRGDLFRGAQEASAAPGHAAEPFVLTAEERAALSKLLGEVGLTVSAEELLVFAERAIVGREYSKFVFTRHLSDALECAAEWGEVIGLSREDLAYLTLADLFDLLHTPVIHDRESFFHERAEERRAEHRLVRSLRLGYVIRSARDLYVVPLHRGAANFVTRQAIEGQAVALDGRALGHVNLYKNIVCIESADPGFDWIFTKGIAGLVTKFGGANSHMTIRCAELGLPAAVGVGEETFDRLAKAGRIELDCGKKIVRPIYG
jgi:hypothetical protein